MPGFDELVQRYMQDRQEVAGGSVGSSGSTVRGAPIRAGCEVIPHASGRAYFRALKAAIDVVPNDGFLYLAGWWCDPAFTLDGPTGASLVDVLKTKARAGVDVRFLGWVVAPEVMQSRLMRAGLSRGGSSMQGVRDLLQLNDQTMTFAGALRGEPRLADRAALNILPHPAGAVHLKFVLLGGGASATGFTGGLDLQAGRWDPDWHDVQAEVRGPVLQDFFEGYREMWEEVRGRAPVRLTADRVTLASHTSGMPALATRSVGAAAGGRMRAQHLQTLPMFDFSAVASTVLPTNDPLSYARNGRFHVKPAWEKAIGGAGRYVYMEDQAFTSGEVFDWINRTVKANDQVRVVLLTGQPDPNDAISPIPKFFGVAVNDHLLAGLSAAQIARVGVFSHTRKVIHSKTTLVDDHWALVGSANAMRRSLYTDFEHAVAYMDEANAAVPAYRTDLWAAHLGRREADLTRALDAWFAIPFAGAGGAGSTRELRDAIVEVAEREWGRWNAGGVARTETQAEVTPVLQDYFRTGVGREVTAADLQNATWQNGNPWSAVFVSYVMREAGAGAHFTYDAAHQRYLAAAKRNREGAVAANPFWAFRPNEHVVAVGDLIAVERGGSGATYENIDGGFRQTHCDVVVEVAPNRVVAIGGNVGHSVTRTTFRTDATGHLATDGDQARVFAVVHARTGVVAVPAAATPAGIERLRVPFAPVALTPNEAVLYDEVYDVDSRQTWGTGLIRLANPLSP